MMFGARINVAALIGVDMVRAMGTAMAGRTGESLYLSTRRNGGE